jgi:hypothetical protein
VGTNGPHKVWCKNRRLASHDASPELLPQIIHHIELKVGAAVLVSEIQKIYQISINLINTPNLGIENFSVDAKENVIYWKKVTSKSHTPPDQVNRDQPEVPWQGALECCVHGSSL